MKVHQTMQKHEDIKRKILDIVKDHADVFSTEEVLAVSSQIVGMLIALQDPAKTNLLEVGDLIQLNMELGNKSMADFVTNKRTLN